MMSLNREHDVMLYMIIQKIRNNQSLNYDDIGNITTIKRRIETIDFTKTNEAQCNNICDIAGKLYYIDKYMKGEY